MTEPTPRQQRIITLAAWYEDVAAGWAEDGTGKGELGIRLMSRAWNHPSYQEFERLRLELRRTAPNTYSHFITTYVTPLRVTRLTCPRCGTTTTPASKHHDSRGHIRLRHKHGGDIIFFRPRAIRIPHPQASPTQALEGVRWIDQHWRPDLDVFIPDELQPQPVAA